MNSDTSVYKKQQIKASETDARNPTKLDWHFVMTCLKPHWLTLTFANLAALITATGAVLIPRGGCCSLAAITSHLRQPIFGSSWAVS